MKSFMCPYCYHSLEAFIPPIRCPSCNTLMIPPEEEQYYDVSLEIVREASIEDYWYCESCGIYRRNDGLSEPPPCPCCSSYLYHNNRENIFLWGLEPYLETALKEAESENPDIGIIRKNLRVAYGWYDRFHLIEDDDQDDTWISQILDK